MWEAAAYGDGNLQIAFLCNNLALDERIHLCESPYAVGSIFNVTFKAKAQLFCWSQLVLILISRYNFSFLLLATVSADTDKLSSEQMLRKYLAVWNFLYVNE